MDKDLFKTVMRDSGIPVAAHQRSGSARRPRTRSVIRSSSSRRALGSSVGISKVASEEGLAAAVETRLPPRREGARRGVRRRHRGRGRRPRQPRPVACRVASRANRERSGTTGTTTSRSTRRRDGTARAAARAPQETIDLFAAPSVIRSSRPRAASGASSISSVERLRSYRSPTLSRQRSRLSEASGTGIAEPIED